GSATGRDGAEAEAGVVPGTADGLADDEAFGEGTAVMTTGRSDREALAAAPDEQDRLAVHVSELRLSVRELFEGETRGQIGALGLRRLVAHVHLSRVSVRTLRVSSLQGVRGRPEATDHTGRGACRTFR